MAILDRVLRRLPRADPPVEEERMSVIEHLEALRRVLIVIVITWALTTIASFFVSGKVIGWLIARAGIGHGVYFIPAGGVLTTLKVAIYIGLILAAPVVIQQIWWFVSPDNQLEFLNTVTTVQPYQLSRELNGAHFVSSDWKAVDDLDRWARATLPRVR